MHDAERATRPAVAARITYLLVALVGAGCTDGSRAEPVDEDPALTTSSSTGSGIGPDSGVVPDGGSDGSAGLPVCPTVPVGPALVLVTTPLGATYCMDARETTRAEYDAFLVAKAGDVSGQIQECSWNKAYTPDLYSIEDDTEHGFACLDTSWNNALPDEAVGCVDFCDSVAYCAWAGKRLCGRVGGPAKWGNVYMGFTGPSDIDAFMQMSSSVEAEFGNVCTQGGTTTYPYGNTYEAQKCIDDAWVESKGDGSKGVTNTAEHDCHGTTPPFDAIHDLSGSVAEWQAMCGVWQGLPMASCRAAGGGWNSSSFSCAGGDPEEIMAEVNPGIGFRCCADTVLAP